MVVDEAFMAHQTRMQISLWTCMTIGVFSREGLKFYTRTFFLLFTVSSLGDLFYQVNAHVIVDFINDVIGFYNHL